MSTKHQPYMEYYMKNHDFLGKFIGHVRVKYVDENGIEHIRGLNQDDLGQKTIYENGIKDSSNIGLERYSASNKVLLSEEQSGQVKELISQMDKGYPKYNFIDSNCVDFVNKFHRIYNKDGNFEDALTPEQKQAVTLSRSYNKAMYKYPIEKTGINSQTVTPDIEIKEDPNPELTRVWDSIMKGGNDEKDDAKKAAAKEEAPEKSYYDRYKELEDPVEDLLYKKPESLTQEVVNQAHKRSFESKDPAERQRYDKIVSEYYRTNYSNRPQQLDETGKGIEPQATRRIPEQGSPLLSSSGRPVDEEIRSTSERLSQIDGNPFHDSGVRGLQRGLNKAGASPQLKEDGELGPKTTSAWKRAATENPAKLNQALGTGSMENLITKNRGTTFSPQDLDNSARSAWGDEGGRTLQRGLNQAGSAKEDYEPLKEDNDVGKKTTSAFNRLKEEDEDGLLSSLNKMIV